MNKDTLLEIPGVQDVTSNRWWNCDGTTWMVFFDTANDVGGMELWRVLDVARLFPRGAEIHICTEGVQNGQLYLLAEVRDDTTN
jgi:hypothetical protein